MSLAANLLQKLGSGIRPAGPEAHPPAPPGPDGPGFADLLAKARDGNLASGLPVTIAKGAGVELNAEQLSRVGAAADRAQAAGADRAVVLIDGAAVKLDVATRNITGVNEASRQTAQGASQTETVATELSKISEQLREVVGHFHLAN